MMRVLFITTCPCFYRVRFFEELGKYCDLTVIYEDGLKDYKSSDGKYYTLDTKDRYHIHPLRSMHVKRYNYAFGLSSFIRKQKFDIVVFGLIESFSSMKAMQMMHRKKMPYILNIDGLDEKKRSRLKEWACSHFIGIAPLLLSPSKSNDNVLMLYGAKQERIARFPFASYYASQVLQKGLETKDRLAIQEELHVQHKRYVVSIGQFIPRKNPLGLLRVWKKCAPSDACLLLVGKGPLEPEVRSLIKELDIRNVEIIGFIDSKVIPLYYRIAEFSVLFSHEDAWGLVISESLANGTPVVATDGCYAATELLQNGMNGELIEDNEQDLERAMRKMFARSEQEQAKQSENAVQRVKDYTIEHMVAVHMRIFTAFLQR